MNIVKVDATTSTNALAKVLNKDKTEHAFCVSAEFQTEGRGQLNSQWQSSRSENLMFTVVFNDLDLEIENQFVLNAMVCLRILRVLKSNNIPNIRFKWPNDIFLQDKKICGILTSNLTYHKYHLIGIGIDSDFEEIPPDLADIMSSLKAYIGEEIENVLILQRFLDEFSAVLPAFIDSGLSFFHAEYLDNSYLLGKTVTIGSEFEEYTGKVMRINKKGAIIIRLVNGMLQPFYSGTINKIYQD